jgi:hypothetical protein|tara:strand:- start:3112 stop:3612 length:501 start_codon:yes stop_codon:yes gene_type:complete
MTNDYSWAGVEPGTEVPKPIRDRMDGYLDWARRLAERIPDAVAAQDAINEVGIKATISAWSSTIDIWTLVANAGTVAELLRALARRGYRQTEKYSRPDGPGDSFIWHCGMVTVYGQLPDPHPDEDAPPACQMIQVGTTVNETPVWELQCPEGADMADQYEPVEEAQ